MKISMDYNYLMYKINGVQLYYNQVIYFNNFKIILFFYVFLMITTKGSYCIYVVIQANDLILSLWYCSMSLETFRLGAWLMSCHSFCGGSEHLIVTGNYSKLNSHPDCLHEHWLSHKININKEQKQWLFNINKLVPASQSN